MRLAALLAAALLLAGCGGSGEGGAEPEAASPDAVADLDNVLQLRADFEADAGTTRVVVLLSPT